MDILDRQRAMWTEGDFPDMAKHIEQVAEVVVDAAGRRGRRRRARRGDRHRQRRAHRRAARGAGQGHGPHAEAAGRGPRARGRRGRRHRVHRGQRAGAVLRRRRVRSRDVGVRIDVRPRSRGDGRRAAARDAPGRHDRRGRVDAAGAQRPDVRGVGEAHAAAAAGLPAAGPVGTRGPRPRALRRRRGAVRAPQLGRSTPTPPRTGCSYCERVLGPIILARAALEPEGKWEAARADLLALYESANEATDGTYHAEAEYLVTVVSRAA